MGTGPREGVLVVRAWVEDHPVPLRAVVTRMTDADATQPSRTTTTSSRDEVVVLVRDWLDELMGR
jgi:hypothetical protein